MKPWAFATPLLLAVPLSGIFLVLGGCVKPGPKADFTADVTSGPAPLTVQFTDTSTPGGPDAPITAWLWDFGDGKAASTEQHPSHTYTAPGSYDVRLTITTDMGAGTAVKTGFITVEGIGPKADFEAAPVEGEPGQLVSFTDTSEPGTGAITARAWDFGDPASGTNNAATGQNPTHRYNAAGTYTVSLTVTTDAGSDTETKQDYITIAVRPVPPVTDFIANPVDAMPGENIQFTDQSFTSAGALVAWRWDFGDGATSTERHPVHAYASTGVFTVSLTATASNGGVATATRENYITISEAPFLSRSARHLVTNNVSIHSAALFFESEYFDAVETLGVDKANEIVDVALAAALADADGVILALRRMDTLVGYPIEIDVRVAGAPPKQDSLACNGTTVLHVNGMNVLFTGFVANMQALSQAIATDPRFAGEDIMVKGIYQRSATDAQFSFFGGVICPLVGNPSFPRLQARLQELCRSAGGALIDLAEAGEQKLRDWVNFPTLVDNPSQLFDYARIRVAVEYEVGTLDRNVVIVPHSQGNFFTRDVVNGLGADNIGNYADAVSVVQVASPTSAMPEPTTRIDICQDPVSRLSSQFSVAGCYPWHASPGGGLDIGAHDFVGAYLSTATGATARNALLQQILDYHLEESNPRAQSDLEIEARELELTPEMPADLIILSIKPPDLGDIAWSASADDPRIDIDVTEGTILSGQTPPHTNEILVTVNDFTEGFIGEVEIQNNCIPDETIGVQIRVPGDNITTIDFDDVEGFGNTVISGDRYAALGVTFTSSENLTALVGTDDFVSPPTSICGLDSTGACTGTVTMHFDPPVSFVTFYVADQEKDRRSPFSIEVVNSSGTVVDFVLSRIDLRFYNFTFNNIARITFTASDDWEAIDSLSFIR